MPPSDEIPNHPYGVLTSMPTGLSDSSLEVHGTDSDYRLNSSAPWWRNWVLSWSTCNWKWVSLEGHSSTAPSSGQFELSDLKLTIPEYASPNLEKVSWWALQGKTQKSIRVVLLIFRKYRTSWMSTCLLNCFTCDSFCEREVFMPVGFQLWLFVILNWWIQSHHWNYQGTLAAWITFKQLVTKCWNCWWVKISGVPLYLGTFRIVKIVVEPMYL